MSDFAGRPLRLQLWSYNYDPEPSGIAPLSGVWARAMQRRGHDVTVIAAHPHYPEPLWGTRLRPYRESRAGVEVLRLPIWPGRQSAAERIRQELSFLSWLTALCPLLPPADAVIAVTPSFPALAPAMAYARSRRVPWLMWLQDILPDGAATTGIVDAGPMLWAARRFEAAAYADAARVVVISDVFQRNLVAKGVPVEKLRRIYNPSAVEIGPLRSPAIDKDPLRLLVMGNIGHSQGLVDVVGAVEASGVLQRCRAEFRIAGGGVERDLVTAQIRSEQVRMAGLLLGQAMEDELATTAVGVVTQRSDVTEFNLPSKVMNYMGHGLPVLAVVAADSETARLVREADAGWVVDSSRLDDIGPAIAAIVADRAEIVRRGANAHRAAELHFAPDRIAKQYEDVILEVLGRAPASG